MKTTIALVAAFLGSIYAAAWAIANIGTQYAPDAPHVLPVGWGLEAPSGVYVVGVTLVLRDLLQRRVGKAATFALILVGAVLAAFVSPAIAIASGIAFLASETVDFALFSIIEPRAGLIAGVAASNTASVVVDSWAFLTLAFGSTDFLAGQVVGKAWATLAGLAILITFRLRARREVAA